MCGGSASTPTPSIPGALDAVQDYLASATKPIPDGIPLIAPDRRPCQEMRNPYCPVGHERRVKSDERLPPAAPQPPPAASEPVGSASPAALAGPCSRPPQSPVRFCAPRPAAEARPARAQGLAVR